MLIDQRHFLGDQSVALGKRVQPIPRVTRNRLRTNSAIAAMRPAARSAGASQDGIPVRILLDEVLQRFVKVRDFAWPCTAEDMIAGTVNRDHSVILDLKRRAELGLDQIRRNG